MVLLETAILTGMRQKLRVILICMFLLPKNNDSFSICIMTIWTNILKIPLKFVFDYFLCGLNYFMRALCIWSTSILSEEKLPIHLPIVSTVSSLCWSYSPLYRSIQVVVIPLGDAWCYFLCCWNLSRRVLSIGWKLTLCYISTDSAILFSYVGHWSIHFYF